MFHKKTEILMPMIFIILAVAAFMYSMLIPSDDGMFMKLIAAVMLVTAVAIMYFTLQEQKNTVDLEGVDLKKVLIMIGVIVVYILALKWIGYLVDTFILGVAVIRFLNYKRWGIIIGFSALVTLLNYTVFQVLLGVPLPMPFFM